jgi:poly(3-hydroxybutyrate) depolymerase
MAYSAPTHPVSVLDIHGTADPIIAYGVQAPSLATFHSADGCRSGRLAQRERGVVQDQRLELQAEAKGLA